MERESGDQFLLLHLSPFPPAIDEALEEEDGEIYPLKDFPSFVVYVNESAATDFILNFHHTFEYITMFFFHFEDDAVIVLDVDEATLTSPPPDD